MAGCTLPFLPGGVHSTMCRQPAMRAGTTSISTVENSGELPPGIYNPTFEIATARCSQRTPGTVSTTTGCIACAAWNRSMLAAAVAMACFSSSLTSCAASAISSSLTRKSASSTPSKRRAKSRNASSPRRLTSATMSPTTVCSSLVLSTARVMSCCHWLRAGYFVVVTFWLILFCL